MPVGTLDQHQDNIGNNFGFGDHLGNTARGQVFRCGITGTLGSIGFDRVKGTQGIKVYIDTVDGGNLPAHAVGSELYSFELTNATLVNGYATYDLPVPVSLTAGTKYVFWLTTWDTTNHVYIDDYHDLHGLVPGTADGITEVTQATNTTWRTEDITFHYATYMIPATNTIISISSFPSTNIVSQTKVVGY